MVQLQDYKDKEQIMRLLMYYDGTDHTRDALNTVKPPCPVSVTTKDENRVAEGS